MPTIPTYNQGATEEAGLTRAKRRVIKAMESGIVKLTEKPDQDLTNGKADDIANMLIGQFEDLTALFRQVVTYFGANDDIVYLETTADAVKAYKIAILAAKNISRVLRAAKALAPVMRYLDLGVLSDLKAAQSECDEAATIAFGVLTNINFEELDADFESVGSVQDEDLEDEEDLGSVASSLTLPSVASNQPKQRRIDSMFQQLNRAAKQLQDADSDNSSNVSSTASTGSRRSASTGTTERKRRETIQIFSRLGPDTYEKLVVLMMDKYRKAISILEIAYANFNEFRKQKVLPAEAVDVAEEIKTGSGIPMSIRKPIYRIGNSALNALYEIDGLPRFI